jgi:elongation factor 1-alpha
MTIQFAPSGIQAKVQSCEVHHEEQSEVGPGINVGFSVKGVSVKEVRRGDVASEANDTAATAVSSFEAQIVVINHPGRITKGYCPVVDCHTAHISCQFVYIRQKLDRRTGKVVEENPEYLQNGDAAIVTMVPTRPMCVESFSEYQALGRITIRDMKRTVAVGIIKSIIKVEVDAEQSNVPR